MRRRHFLEGGFFGGAAAMQAQTPPPARETEGGGTGSTSYQTAVTLERRQTGKPRSGQVVVAIQPHCDDIPIFAAGTVLKLIDEGCTGYLVTMSDDSMAGEGPSYGDIILKNERDTMEVARRLGCKDAFFLKYPNHSMDAWPIVEIRSRLTFLFRMLKADIVVVYDPSALYERNPDHYVTARAVEWAAAISGDQWDYPEHFKAGLKPHAPKERYYFARGPQIVNRVVDISGFIDQKVLVNVANITQGPAGHTGRRLRQKLASQGQRLPILGADDDTADRQYTKQFALARDRSRGQAHGFEYAEYFHYIGPDDPDLDPAYLRQNVVPL